MKNTPLRDFASKSYDSRTGRSASAFSNGAPTTHEGERIVPNDQIQAAYGKPGRGSPTCDWINRNRSNGAGTADGDGDGGE